MPSRYWQTDLLDTKSRSIRESFSRGTLTHRQRYSVFFRPNKVKPSGFRRKPSSARWLTVFSPKTLCGRHTTFAAYVLRDFGLRAGILNLLNSSYYGKHIYHRNLAAMRYSVRQQIRTDTALPGLGTVIRNTCSVATTIQAVATVLQQYINIKHSFNLP